MRPRPCENTCVRSLGAIVGASPPLCEYMFVCSLGYIVGASPPRVCPFIGRHSSLDPCMLPTPLCGIFKLRLGALIPRSVGLSVCLSVGLSVGLSSKNYKKNIKLYKTLQNLPNHSGYCHQQCRGVSEQCHTQIFYIG